MFIGVRLINGLPTHYIIRLQGLSPVPKVWFHIIGIVTVTVTLNFLKPSSSFICASKSARDLGRCLKLHSPNKLKVKLSSHSQVFVCCVCQDMYLCILLIALRFPYCSQVTFYAFRAKYLTF